MNRMTHLRRYHWVVTMTLLVFLFGAAALFADAPETPDDLERLRQVIEDQQRRLEAQQRELDAQRKMMQELMQQVRNLTDVAETESIRADSMPPEVPEAFAADQDANEPDWPGSFSLFGSKTRFKIGGFAQLDLIYDTDAIATRGEFVTAAIPTDGGTKAEGADGQTTFSVNASRLTFESRTPTSLGRLKTFFSLDLFDDPNTPGLRMRQAYGELSGALWGGDLLLGQAWGTYVDLEAWPDLVDFEGPDSAIAVRQPQLRWSKGVSESIDVQIALEQPGGGTVEGTDVLTRWPDLVSTVKWTRGGGHLRGAGILRDIRVSTDDGPVQTALGWGLAGSGRVVLPAESYLVFEASYGEGTGNYYNDGVTIGAIDPADSSFDLLPVFAYYVGLGHAWSPSLSSAVLYAEYDLDNLDYQPDDAGSKSGYFSLNLIWRPDPSLMFGAEFLRGGREDKDGAEGTDNRIQLTGQFSF